MTKGDLAVLNDVSRRRVLEMGAWTAPALMMAVAAPQSAASGDPVTPPDPNLTPVEWTSTGQLTSNNVEGGRSTGFLPFDRSDSQHATASWTSFPGSTEGFLSMDDSDSTTDTATVRVVYTFTAQANVVYVFAVPLKVAWGGSGIPNSSRQSLVISTIAPSGAKEPVYKATVDHDSTEDAALSGQGYELIEPSESPTNVSKTFIAGESGTYTLEYLFTIAPKQTGQDKYCADMWLGLPTLIVA